MDNNIIFEIKEIKEEDKKLDNDKNSEFLANVLDYELNYNMKQIGRFLDYYEINKNKLTKKMAIEKLVNFEIVPINEPKVNKRKLLFDYLLILKSDKYFKRFIIDNF